MKGYGETTMDNEASKATEKSTKFREIATHKDLIAFLNSLDRLKSKSFLYHYTTIGNAIAIFKSKTWHLANPEDMNDTVEYHNGDQQRWKNIFFASFMAENKESIAMWSMYSQPWKDGVKIAIPMSAVKRWLKSIDEILEVSSSTYELTGNSLPVNKQNIVRLSSVAYSNATSCGSENDMEVLTWSNQRNTNIANGQRIPELTGYIKDNAWDYEKEVRLKAEFENIFGFRRVAIRIPDDVLDEITISAGPLFEGDLLQRMNREIQRSLHADQSFFTGKLKIKSICERCQYKPHG